MVGRGAKKKLEKLVLAFFMCSFFVQNGAQALEQTERKGYLDELEEAYVAKIAQSRAERRLKGKRGDGYTARTSSTSSNLDMLKAAGGRHIGADAVNSIKTGLKEPFLNLLASSELITWPELKDRFDKAKKALELFEVRYKSELATAGDANPALAASKGAAKPVAGLPVPGMPGISAMPGVAPVKIKPAVKKADEEDDEEEDEEEDEGPAKPKVVPGKAAGMPGLAPVKPVIIPGAKPVAIPAASAAKKPAAGGMPMA